MCFEVVRRRCKGMISMVSCCGVALFDLQIVDTVDGRAVVEDVGHHRLLGWFDRWSSRVRDRESRERECVCV